MDGTDFLTAIALLLIIEGLMPFASPEKWQKMLRSIIEIEPDKIRMIGLMSMLGGLFLLFILS